MLKLVVSGYTNLLKKTLSKKQDAYKTNTTSMDTFHKKAY
jgi:hypothetical protein